MHLNRFLFKFSPEKSFVFLFVWTQILNTYFPFHMTLKSLSQPWSWIHESFIQNSYTCIPFHMINTIVKIRLREAKRYIQHRWIGSSRFWKGIRHVRELFDLIVMIISEVQTGFEPEPRNFRNLVGPKPRRQFKNHTWENCQEIG